MQQFYTDVICYANVNMVFAFKDFYTYTIITLFKLHDTLITLQKYNRNT